MKVVHIISGIARSSGGPSRSSQGLVAALNAAGVEAWLVTCTPGEKPWLPGVERFRAPSRPGLLALRAFLRETLATLKPDLVHLHGLWQPQIHFAACAAREAAIPYVISPRGMLEPWSLQQGKWKKRLAMALYQRRDLREAVALHATAMAEAGQFYALGFTQKVLESPNGVAEPTRLPPRALRKDGFRRVLFMSRIHRKKGLLDLVEAWERVRPQGWKVEIVGTDADGYQRVVEEAVRKKSLQNDFVFTGPLMDDDKWQAYARADLFVLPTYSENFGIVVPEALYAGVPVITTKGTPWAELEFYRCGRWIDLGVEPLVLALREMISITDEQRAAMGARGQTLVKERYTWPAIGRKMAQDYAELLGQS